MSSSSGGSERATQTLERHENNDRGSAHRRKLSKCVYDQIERWRNRPIESRFPYVYLDGLFMKMSSGDGVQHVDVLVAIGVDDDGYREVLGVCHGGKEDKESWLRFLRHLKTRGLPDPAPCISDGCPGAAQSALRGLFEGPVERCVVHFYRNVSTQVPRTKVRDAMAMLKAVHAQENRPKPRRRPLSSSSACGR